MKRFALPGAIGLLLALGLHVAPAQAQLARTFVSSLGNDANDCGRPTPCRTFQRAHDNTLANGEITVLDPGGYGAVTITKTISIINDGVGEAGALVSGGANGITVSAGAGDRVSLRGLTIKGIGFGGGNGIVFNSGASLTIENCAIRNHTNIPLSLSGGKGIWYRPNASSSLAVSNTFIADNEDSGILLLPSGSGIVKAVFSRVELYNNGFTGLLVDGSFSTGTINATVLDSVAHNNGITGFSVRSTVSQAAARLMLVRSAAANNNQSGVTADGGNATVRIGQSTVTGNTAGWLAIGGATVRSYGNNNIDGNTSSEAAPTAIPPK